MNSGTGNPVDILVRVEPDLRRHDREQQVRPRAQPVDAKLLALQIANGLDGLVREQLVAPGMHARERRDRLAGIQMSDYPCGGVELEVDFTACDGVERCVRRTADFSEPFRAQQVVSDEPRREADIG